MKYVVIEIQKFTDGTIAVPPVSTYDSFFDAMSKYHTVLSVAANSEVPIHSCVCLTDTGQQIRLDSFNHTSGEPAE